MANILDEQERKRKELAAQGIHTRGVAGAQGGPAEMTYKPLEQRTGAEAKALGVSPQMQAQIAQEQGLIPPAALPATAVTPSQAPEQQARVTAPQAQGVTPQAQAANQQLEAARAGMGANRARSNARLTDMAEQVDPRIREDANLRREWRMMTPQQRKEYIGLKKLEMDARGAEDAVAGATWEDIDKMSRSFADATGTAMDSYGNSFYTPDQQMFIREQRRNIDRAAGEMFSQADRSAWRTPQDMYQAIASLPEVQQAGPFGQAYAFNIMRRYATPQLRAQMEAEDRNQGLFTEWFNSKTEAEIAEMQQASGMRMTADGSKDFAAELFLNRDKDIGAGSIYQRFLSESPQVFTAINGRVQVDPVQKGRFEQAQAQRKAESDAAAKEEELRALEAYEDQQYAAIQQMNPERAAMMIKNPITRKYEDLKEFKAGSSNPVDISKVNTAYAEARKSHQTVSRQMEIQQIDPIEFKKKAISDAVLFGAEDFEKQGIDSIINSISVDNDMSAKEIINAIAASGFGNVFNAEAFQKAMTEYEEAKNMSPQVLDAQKRMLEEKIDQIERDAYGVDADKSTKIPVVTTQEDFDALPSGATFVEDGVTYRKP